MCEDNKKGMLEGLRAELGTLSSTLREGFGGFKDFCSKKNFLVRSVYKDVVIPFIGEVQYGNRASSFTTSSTPQKVSWEMDVDTILITPAQDILISCNENGLNPMLLKASVTYSLAWRTKTLYITQSTAAGTCYVWGLY